LQSCHACRFARVRGHLGNSHLDGKTFGRVRVRDRVLLSSRPIFVGQLAYGPADDWRPLPETEDSHSRLHSLIMITVLQRLLELRFSASCGYRFVSELPVRIFIFHHKVENNYKSSNYNQTVNEKQVASAYHYKQRQCELFW